MKEGHSSSREPGPIALPLEIVAIWAFVAFESLAILVTYWRVPPHELYHVSGTGLEGGASRVLVYLNWPVALVAIPILLVLAERLPARGPRIVAGVGVALCAAVFWPGLVKESDLDARGVNAIAAIGVLLAVAVTVMAASRLGVLDRLRWQRGDGIRLGLAVAALVLAVPWLAAELGLSFNSVPILGTLYQTGELRTQPGMPELHPAVHHGYHHGMAGTLLVLAALALSRIVPSIAHGWLRGVLAAYLALMFCYGAGNIANDFWLEQVVKRGWMDWEIPNVTTPKASVGWGLILVGAALIWLVYVWRGRRDSGAPISSAAETA
jgi:hypothetical protein